MSEARPPLLLLPGTLNDAELWRDQLRDLAGVADCRVGDLTGGDTLDAIARQVLDTAPPAFALAGFSLGGYVAQQILRLASPRVTRLALLDTSFRADTPQRAARRQAQEAAVRRGSFHGFGDAMARAYLDPSHHGDAALVARIRAMTARLGADVFLRQSALRRGDGTDILAAFDRPALVLCGEHDRITPPEVHREMAALMPQARLVVVPQSGHLTPLEQPQAVSRALREWLLA